MKTPTSEKLFKEACEKIPGGVNSPVRAWKGVGGMPRFIVRGRGAEIVDADGNVYVDYVGSWGALILGHAAPEVCQAVDAAARKGTTFGAPTPAEVELAAVVCGAFPSIEKIRLVSSGTEATMSAVRLARAFTGRSKVVKFDGCYHGHADGLLVRAGSGAATLALPDSPGVPAAFAAETAVLRFNDDAALRGLFAERGAEVAAVIVEPVCGNMGVIPPRPEFLRLLREVTQRHGSLLIFDEVITGFRVGFGGAQAFYGVAPDLTCLGKILGGGLPVGAFGGRREIMDLLAPDGPVYQAGTLAGNPLAVGAGLVTLQALQRPGVYERLENAGAALQQGLEAVLRAREIPGVVNRVGSMWTLFFGLGAVTDADEARRADRACFARFFHGMLEQGIYLPPSPFEAAFVSLAHTEDHLARTLRVFESWADAEAQG